MDLLDIGDLLDLFDGTGTDICGGLYRWYMKRKTRRWPVTPITIMHKGLKELHRVTLSYHYRVEGESYGGFYERSFLNASGAKQYLQQFDNRGPIFASYDPRRPERSWISG